ncbi:MAG: hypothetical protein QXF26_02505 [Candidatus Bathyarchaeia archaeon]
MPETAERKLNNISRVLEKLCKEASYGIPILVEGKNDVEALRMLNVIGETIAMKNSGRVLDDMLQEIRSHEVIVFVDFDRHGSELAKKILLRLEHRGVKANLAFWRMIRALVRRDVKDVEGLPTYLQHLKEDVEG